MFLLSGEKIYLKIYKMSENMHFWSFLQYKMTVKAYDNVLKF